MSTVDELKALKHLATRIADNNMSDDDRDYLSNALSGIADGTNPKTALGIIGKKGKATSKSSIKRIKNRKLAMGWIAAAMSPKNEMGLGLTLEQACDEAAEQFHLSSETLKTYCYRYKEEKTPFFDLD